MARVLKLDKAQYNQEGVLPLFRGDDWALVGKIVDIVNGYETGVDLSNSSATGYFPAASGEPIAAPAVTGSCGTLTIGLPAASTVLTDVNSGGIGLYVVIETAGVIQTVPTPDQAVVIQDREFQT